MPLHAPVYALTLADTAHPVGSNSSCFPRLPSL